jgi:hypothetical protein
VIRVDASREPADRYTRNALQRFGHRTIRQCTDILGRNRIDDDFGILLDRLRALQAAANTGDDDVLAGGLFLRGGGGLLGLRRHGATRRNLCVRGRLCLPGSASADSSAGTRRQDTI